MAALIAALGGVAAVVKILTPVAAALIGWLIPSPFQKAETNEAKIHADERKAQDSRGDVSSLDNIP